MNLLTLLKDDKESEQNALIYNNLPHDVHLFITNQKENSYKPLTIMNLQLKFSNFTTAIYNSYIYNRIEVSYEHVNL